MGENLLTYTDSCVSKNYYKFYTDEAGLNELTPKINLYLNNTYIFHRLQDGSEEEHPFYISDAEPDRNLDSGKVNRFNSVENVNLLQIQVM